MTSNSKSLSWGYILLGLAFVVVAIFGVFAIIAMLGMWAWSIFMVPVFGLPLLSFQEALGAVMLLFVARLIFLQPTFKRMGK